jgi:hypothetical protein
MGELVLDTEGPDAALPWYRKALTAAREVDAGAPQAEALEGVARCLADTDRAAALEAQQEAVDVYRRLAVPELSRAEEFLAELRSPAFVDRITR